MLRSVPERRICVLNRVQSVSLGIRENNNYISIERGTTDIGAEGRIPIDPRDAVWRKLL